VSEHIDEPGAEQESWEPVVPRLPRPAAVTGFVGQLVKAGLSDNAANAIANAVLNPDEARRRLVDPAQIRVQGGTLLVIDVMVWAPAISVYPVNPRELGEVKYRVSGGANTQDIFRSVRTARNRYAELAVTAARPDVMIDRLRSAETWLGRNNKLVDDVAADGVLQPIVLSALSVAHRDRSLPITLLAAIDGSSRTTATHQLLDVDGGEYAYEAPPGSRALRQRLGRLIRLGDDVDWDKLDEDTRQRLRALTMPARVIIGYRPATRHPVEFHVAVRNLIGLTHIRPPRAYGRPVEDRAKADAVIDYLRDAPDYGGPYLGDAEANWFRGDLLVSEAEAEGLSAHLDVRAAELARKLIAGGRRTTLRVNAGIRSLTAKQVIQPTERVDIAVELALRPMQGVVAEDHAADPIPARRAALQRALRLAGLVELPFDEPWSEGLPDSPVSLKDLRDAALAETMHIVQGNSLEPAQIELAVKAAYYMVTASPMAVRREGYGVQGPGMKKDAAAEVSVPVLLRNMVSRAQGVHQAYSIIVAGRAGTPLRVVDDDGEIARERGKPLPLTDTTTRQLYAQAPVTETTTGPEGAANRWRELNTAFHAFEAAWRAMGDVESDSGSRYLDDHGWPSSEIGPLRTRLDRIDRRLADWADRDEQLQERRRHEEEEHDGDGDG
jgi:hypothetical protein